MAVCLIVFTIVSIFPSFWSSFVTDRLYNLFFLCWIWWLIKWITFEFQGFISLLFFIIIFFILIFLGLRHLGGLQFSGSSFLNFQMGGWFRVFWLMHYALCMTLHKWFCLRNLTRNPCFFFFLKVDRDYGYDYFNFMFV